MSGELVERLNRRHPKHGNYGYLSPGALINPDGPEAAALIEAQASEIEGLRKALEAASHKLTEAGTIFFNYEQLHRSKHTQDGDEKAAKNAEFSRSFDAAAKAARTSLTDPKGRGE